MASAMASHLGNMKRRGRLKGRGKFSKVMHEFKAGSLHSGSKSGPVVRTRAQAKAIAVSEAKKAGEY